MAGRGTPGSPGLHRANGLQLESSGARYNGRFREHPARKPAPSVGPMGNFSACCRIDPSPRMICFSGRDSPLIAGMCCRRWGLLLRYCERPECRCRRQHRQPLHQLERLRDDVRRSVPPAVLETIDQPAVGQKRQPFRCQRGTVGSIAKRLRQPTFPFV